MEKVSRHVTRPHALLLSNVIMQCVLYSLCWYLLPVLVFITFIVGIYYLCWYLQYLLVFATFVGIYYLYFCWYLLHLVFTGDAGEHADDRLAMR